MKDDGHFRLFALVTRRPYCPGRPKKLCFTTPSLAPTILTGKTKLFWSPGTIWPPCDKGELKDTTKAGAIIGDGSVPDYGSWYPASRGPFDVPRKVDFSRKIEGTSALRIGSWQNHKWNQGPRRGSLLRRRSLGSSRNILVREEYCVTSPKSVCVGG